MSKKSSQQEKIPLLNNNNNEANEHAVDMEKFLLVSSHGYSNIWTKSINFWMILLYGRRFL